jgi:membrane associated rhomboid family serine protease
MRPDFRSFARSFASPVNLGLIAVLVVAFVLKWGGVVKTSLFFSPDGWQAAPWGWVTYPLEPTGGFLGIFFACLWLFQCGSMVERDLGALKYGLTILVLGTLSAICVFVGYLVMQQAQPLAGPYLWLAFVTIMWATRGPLNTVLMFGLIPIQARWLGWLSAGLVFFGTSPQLALFSAIPLILAWAFASDKLPIAYGAPRPKKKQYAKNVRENDEYFAEADRRTKEREERERLRKLFESSLDDDPPGR